MVQQLTDMELTKVSAVDRGANGKRFAVLKRDGDEPIDEVVEPTEEHKSLLQKIAHALGFAVDGDVAKAQTFAAIISGQQLSDALYDAWYTLQDSMWSAVYATDDNGADLALEAKQALVAQNLDEFKAWLLAQMDTGITKGAGDPADAMATRTLGALVRKVGKKISAARMARLQEAADALTSVLAEVAVESEDDSEAKKRADAQEDQPMTSEELAQIQKMFTDTVAPIAADVAELKKASGKADEKVEDVTKGAGATDDGDWTMAGIGSAISKLIDRVEKIEHQRGERTSATGQDTTGGDVKKRGTFAGVLRDA